MSPLRVLFIRVVFTGDALVGLGLLIPGLLEGAVPLLLQAHETLGLAGDLQPLTPEASLLARTTGLFLMLWSLAHLAGPNEHLARLDLAGRLLLAAAVAWAITSTGISALLWAMVAGESLLAVAHLVFLLRDRRLAS